MRHGVRIHSAPTLALALDAVGILPRRGGGRESSTGVG
jgi:hypothetical protein